MHNETDPTPPITTIMSLPIAFWLLSLGADVMYRRGGAVTWDDIAFFTMCAGVVVALLTVMPRCLDEILLHRPRVTAPALLRLILGVLALYVLNLSLRAIAPYGVLPVVLSFAGLALLANAGAIGGPLARHRAEPVRPVLVTIELRRHRPAASA